MRMLTTVSECVVRQRKINLSYGFLPAVHRRKWDPEKKEAIFEEGSARIEGNNTTLADYVESKIEGTSTRSDQLREIANIEEAMPAQQFPRVTVDHQRQCRPTVTTGPDTTHVGRRALVRCGG